MYMSGFQQDDWARIAGFFECSHSGRESSHGGWGPGCFDFWYRAPHLLNKATAAWLMVVNTLLNIINIYQLQIIQYIGHGVYIYRYI